MKFKYLLVLVVVVFTSFQAGVEPVIRVRAVGLASPGIPSGARARAAALRAAKVEGYKKIARASGMDIGEEAFLKGARLVKKTYITDHIVEVVMEMPRSQSGKSGISSLKKEIKTIETRILNLERRIAKLKKRLELLEQKIKMLEKRK